MRGMVFTPRRSHSAMAPAMLLHLGILATALLAPVVAAPGNTTTTATMPCPSSYQCGDDAVAVRYPFWVAGGNGDGTANASSHCGYPGLGLECRRDTPVLRLPSGEYGVSSIHYGNGTLSVFDLAATSNGSCPAVAGRNLTLPAGSPPPLSLASRDRNLTFFVDCNFTGLASDHRVGCLQHGRRLFTYVFRSNTIPYHYARLCQQVVGMPVLNPAANDVVAALRTGFELSWSPPAAGGECAACEQAGGQCGQLREVERWVFTCIKPASPASEPTSSPASKPTSPASPATRPFLPHRALAFSLTGMMLLLG